MSPYTIDPTFYKQHLHKDLLHLTDQLLRARDTKQLQTQIGKGKSHTNIEYNEAADMAARAIVDGKVPRTSHSTRQTHPSGASAHGHK